MARHHDEIVAAASRMLRERGIQGLSVADLMQAAGLTHGGFYRHFASKEALVAEATRAAFSEVMARFELKPGRSTAAAALKDYVADYLSIGHLEQPGIGCPIAAYGADIGREGNAVRLAYTEGLEILLAEIGKGLACPLGKRRARAAELLSLLCGTVVTARASGSSPMASDILASAHRRASEIVRAKE